MINLAGYLEDVRVSLLRAIEYSERLLRTFLPQRSRRDLELELKSLKVRTFPASLLFWYLIADIHIQCATFGGVKAEESIIDESIDHGRASLCLLDYPDDTLMFIPVGEELYSVKIHTGKFLESEHFDHDGKRLVSGAFWDKAPLSKLQLGRVRLASFGPFSLFVVRQNIWFV